MKRMFNENKDEEEEKKNRWKLYIDPKLSITHKHIFPFKPQELINGSGYEKMIGLYIYWEMSSR